MRMVHTGLVAAVCLGFFSAAALAQTAPAARPPQNYPPQNYQQQPQPNYQPQQQNPNYAQPRTATLPPRAQEYGPQPPAGYGQGAQGAPQQTVPNQPAGAAPGAPTKQVPPAPPFVLTPEQQAHLDQILATWEKQSEKVTKFKCQFNRWEYDPTYGPKDNNFLRSEGKGEVKFKAPDHGVYRVSVMKEWDGGQYAEKKEGLDHWVCNGDAIFQFETANKRLIETKLPPHMKGKAIADGPLPFIFGANAATLKRRYLMRDFTPSDMATKQIWLEAYPRFQSDAANFQRVEFILTRADFLPYALQIYLPMGKQRMVYQFTDIKINSIDFFDTDFSAPRTPFGWKKEIVGAAVPPPAQPPFNPVQAQRPGAGATK